MLRQCYNYMYTKKSLLLSLLIEEFDCFCKLSKLFKLSRNDLVFYLPLKETETRLNKNYN